MKLGPCLSFLTLLEEHLSTVAREQVNNEESGAIWDLKGRQEPDHVGSFRLSKDFEFFC